MFTSKTISLGVVCLLTAVTNGTPVAQPRSSTSGKRGVPYNSAALANLFESSSEVTWGYNWYYEPLGLSSHFEYVPLLYSDPTGNQQYIDEWEGNVTNLIKNGTQHLLAFNEPDINGINPKQAAASYMKFMQPFASSTVKLGAPAVTNGGAPDGLTWLGEFLGNCTSCTIDFIPFHWYCGYNNINYFTNYVEQAYIAGGKRPLWITEFMGDNVYCNEAATESQQNEFMNTVIPWLDSLSYVERYAYFFAAESTSSTTYLVNQAGNGFSETGQTYATLTKVNGTTPTALVD